MLVSQFMSNPKSSNIPAPAAPKKQPAIKAIKKELKIKGIETATKVVDENRNVTTETGDENLSRLNECLKKENELLQKCLKNSESDMVTLNAKLGNLTLAMSMSHLQIISDADKQKRPMKLAIDLGNSTCRMCSLDSQTSSVERIQDGMGRQVWPSGLRFYSLELKSVVDPIEHGIIPKTDDDIGCLKRIVGLNCANFVRARSDHEFLLPCKQSTAEEDRAEFEFSSIPGQRFIAETLMGLQLRKLKNIAEVFLKAESVAEECNLTVPGFCGNHQRQSLIDVAKAAGFCKVTLVNETFAAWKIFQKIDSSKSQTSSYLFISMGASHYEVSCFQNQSEKIAKRACASKSFGGEFIDCLIMKNLLRESRDFPDDCRASMKDHCRKMKESFSMGLKSVTFSVAKHEFKMTLAEFDELLLHNVWNLMKLFLSDILAHCQIMPSEVVLVGGNMRIPFFQQAIRNLLPNVSINKQLLYPEATADGAALCLTSNNWLASPILFDVKIESMNAADLYIERAHFVDLPNIKPSYFVLPEGCEKVTKITIAQQNETIAMVTFPEGRFYKSFYLYLELDENAIIKNVTINGAIEMAMKNVHITDSTLQTIRKTLADYDKEVADRLAQSEMIDQLDQLLQYVRCRDNETLLIARLADEWEPWRRQNQNEPAEVIIQKINEIKQVIAAQGLKFSEN